MEKRIRLLLTIGLMAACTAMIAQSRVGLKAGLSTFNVATSPVIIYDGMDAPATQMSIHDSKIGFHLGFFYQATFGPFFVQPELLVNSQTVEFRFEDLQGSEPDQLRDEVYQTLDMPLIIGGKFGPVRIGGGVIGHLFLSSNSDINDFEGYEQRFDRFNMGWQAGIGVDIWKLHIDARYEGNFNNFGSHMYFNGTQYQFDAPPSRILLSIGLSF